MTTLKTYARTERDVSGNVQSPISSACIKYWHSTFTWKSQPAGKTGRTKWLQKIITIAC